MLSQLARLDEKPEPVLDLDFNEVSARIIQALTLDQEGGNRQQVKDILRNLIHRIEAVREGNYVKGMITYNSPASAYAVCPHGDSLHKRKFKSKIKP